MTLYNNLAVMKNSHDYTWVVVVVVLGFYVPPTAKVIRRQDLGFMSSERLEKPGIELTTPGLPGK